MRLNDIKPLNEATTDEPDDYQFKSDYSAEAGKRLTDDQFQLAYNLVKREEMDKSQIRNAAAELSETEGFGRTVASAEFVLSRMHILVHGLAPHGETQNRAETMFTIPETMVKFAQRQGYDVFENIERAKRDLKDRPVRVKEQDAKQMMVQYYQANKDRLPKNISQHRENIILDIMAGGKPEEVFAKYAQG